MHLDITLGLESNGCFFDFSRIYYDHAPVLQFLVCTEMILLTTQFTFPIFQQKVKQMLNTFYTTQQVKDTVGH